MNILITGAEGQLGQCFKNVVVKNSIQNQHNYYFTDKLSVDITKYEDIETYVKINNINMIVNLAAYTNVESAEDNVISTINVNSIGVRNMAKIMKDIEDQEEVLRCVAEIKKLIYQMTYDITNVRGIIAMEQ